MTGSGDEIDRLAESLNRMLGRIEELMDKLRHVTSDIAHDHRTPLGRLRQRLEAARIKQRSPAAYEEVIDASITDTDTLLRTFDAMLRIAEIEAGAARARFAAVDLSAIAENVGEVFLPVAEDHGQRLMAEVAPGVGVHGDRELITQMLVNLIENSLHHAPQGTLVPIGLEKQGDFPILVVADSGQGIPIEERERVLRRFYRLDGSRSSPGSGLGLSLVAAIAKLHGAELTLDDNNPGLRVSVRFRKDPYLQSISH